MIYLIFIILNIYIMFLYYFIYYIRRFADFHIKITQYYIFISLYYIYISKSNIYLAFIVRRWLLNFYTLWVYMVSNQPYFIYSYDNTMTCVLFLHMITSFHEMCRIRLFSDDVYPYF